MIGLSSPAERLTFIPFNLPGLKASRYNVIVPEDGASSHGMLVYNTLTGAAAELSAAEAKMLSRYLEGPPLSHLDGLSLLKEVDALFSAGFLVPSLLDEAGLVRGQRLFWQKDRSHLDLTIAPTLRCNFRCTYCGQEKAPVSFSRRDLDRLTSFLGRVIGPGTRRVTVHWYGGEPTLRVDAVRAVSRELVGLADRFGSVFEAEMYTNAWRLNEDICPALSREGRISTLMVSLDGPRDIHDRMRGGRPGLGGLEGTLDRVELAVRYFDIKIRIHCHLENVTRIGELLEELHRRGLDRTEERAGHSLSVHFSKLYDFTSVCSHVRNIRLPHRDWGAIQCGLLEQAASMGFKVVWLPKRSAATYCMGQRENAFLIVPRGYVYKCYNQNLTDPKGAAGRLSDPEIPYRLIGGLDPADDERCADCLYLPICSGECPLQAWSEIPCTHLKGNLERRLVQLWKQQRKRGG